MLKTKIYFNLNKRKFGILIINLNKRKFNILIINLNKREDKSINKN